MGFGVGLGGFWAGLGWFLAFYLLQGLRVQGFFLQLKAELSNETQANLGQARHLPALPPATR